MTPSEMEQRILALERDKEDKSQVGCVVIPLVGVVYMILIYLVVHTDFIAFFRGTVK